MVTSKITKNVVCILLSLILIFDTTYINKHESDAFAFALTPILAKVLIAGAVACGIIVATDEDAQKLAKAMWNSMSSGLKEVIEAQEAFATVAASGVMIWSSESWNGFKDFISSFLNINGGTLEFSIPSTDMDSYNVPIQGTSFDYIWKYNPDYWVYDELNDILHSYSGYNTFKIFNIGYATLEFALVPKSDLNNIIWIQVGSIPTPVLDEFRTYNLPYIQKKSNGVYLGDINLSQFFTILNGDVVYNNNNSICLIPDIPIEMSLDDALWQYYTGGVSSTGSVDYSVDAPYFPTSENSICPDIPAGKAMTMPIPDVYNPGQVIGKTGVIDVPVDFPLSPGTIAPPVAPPIDTPNSSFLQKILDWLAAIWAKIASLPGAIISGLISSLSNLLKTLFIPRTGFFSDAFNQMVDNINNRLGAVSIDLTRFNVERIPKDIYITVFGVRNKIFDATTLIKGVGLVRSWIVGLLGLLAIFYNYRMINMFFKNDNFVQNDNSTTKSNGKSKKGS